MAIRRALTNTGEFATRDPRRAQRVFRPATRYPT